MAVSIKTLERRLDAWSGKDLPQWLSDAAPKAIEEIKRRIEELKRQQK